MSDLVRKLHPIVTVWISLWENADGEMDCEVFLTEPPEDVVTNTYVVERVCDFADKESVFLAWRRVEIGGNA